MALRKPLYQDQTGSYSVEMEPGDTAAFGGLTLTGDIAMGGNKVTGLGNPTNPQDAVTKYYADAIASGLDVKASVRVATTAALPAVTAAGTGIGKTLTANANGALTIDGVTIVNGNRILVKDQVAGADNGIYYQSQLGDGSNPFILTRALDADQDAEVTAGLFTFVEEGTNHDNEGWTLVTNNPIVVDTTALTFSRFSSTTAYTFDQGLLQTGFSITVELDAAANQQGAGAGGGSSGLEFDVNSASGKLRAAVHATGGLQRSATGLSLLLADTSLATSASGASVFFAPKVERSRVVAEAIAVADAVYQSTTNNRVGKARADTVAKAQVIGIAITAQGSAGSNAFVVENGVALGVLSGAAAGDEYYLGDTGGIVNARPSPSNRVISVGFAENATDLKVQIVDYGRRAA